MPTMVLPSTVSPLTQDLLGVPSYEELARAPALPGGHFPLIPQPTATSAFVQDLLTKVRVCNTLSLIRCRGLYGQNKVRARASVWTPTSRLGAHHRSVAQALLRLRALG